VRARNPKGHPENPLSPDELRDKFHRLASTASKDRDRVEEIFHAWSGIARAERLGGVLDLLADLRAGAQPA
jgi:2-methylcitrate dehydratase PrpD